MAKRERDKGTRGELEVAAIFRSYGFDCDRVPNSGGLRIKGDLYGSVPVHVETKRQEVLRIPLWIAQAETEAAGRSWLLAFRRNRTPWYGTMLLDRLAGMLSLERDFVRGVYEGRGLTSWQESIYIPPMQAGAVSAEDAQATREQD